MLTGVWYDRTALYEARRRGERVRLADFASEETVELTPLPCWQHLEAEEVRERVAQMIGEIEHQHHLDRTAKKQGVPGARSILLRDPHDRPETMKKGPAPRFHAATREAWLALREGVQQFAEAFREAAQALKRRHPSLGFPEGSFPPNLPPVAISTA